MSVDVSDFGTYWKDYDPKTGIGDPSTPVSAAKLNAREADYRALYEATEGFKDAAEAAATATTDSIVNGIVTNTGSATRTSLNGLYATSAGLATKAPQNLAGTFAARPAATAVPAGTVYYATDVWEAYRSDAATWTVIPSGGSELGRANIAVVFSTASTTPVDITGLSVTFTAPVRPVRVGWSGFLSNSTASAFYRVSLVVGSTTWKNIGGATTASTFYEGTVTVTGLTPGATVTVKAQLAANSGGGTANTGSTTAGSQSTLWVETT